ncbi:hypothetical protein BA059_21925 [Mycolicibacterium sp. (ex Dasyatis americana)]|nr:hypothetical protein BA059_21925 [Mycolicibacterium sp. (ex Dasyatis americana)]
MACFSCLPISAPACAFTIGDLDRRKIIVSTIKTGATYPEGVEVGAIIMLGTLFGLIVLIVGLVLYFDPEARRTPPEAPQVSDREVGR